MRVAPSPPSEILRELRLLLASDQMPVQEEIARKVEIAQSLVSRALNGRLCRVTDNVARLHAYASSIVGAAELAKIAAAALEAEAEPEEPTRIPGGDAAPPPSPSPATFRSEALRGIESYLADGFDPRLVVEQLAVLRRAQQVRRAGRPRPGAS